jgi:hypothetical protein
LRQVFSNVYYDGDVRHGAMELMLKRHDHTSKYEANRHFSPYNRVCATMASSHWLRMLKRHIVQWPRRDTFQLGFAIGGCVTLLCWALREGFKLFAQVKFHHSPVRYSLQFHNCPIFGSLFSLVPRGFQYIIRMTRQSSSPKREFNA